jgi:hypothetical protein
MDDNGFFEMIVSISEFAITELSGILVFRALAESYLGEDPTAFAFQTVHTLPSGFDFHSEEVEALNRSQSLETNAPVIPASESVMINQTRVRNPKKPSYTTRISCTFDPVSYTDNLQ